MHTSYVIVAPLEKHVLLEEPINLLILTFSNSFQCLRPQPPLRGEDATGKDAPEETFRASLVLVVGQQFVEVDIFAHIHTLGLMRIWSFPVHV